MKKHFTNILYKSISNVENSILMVRYLRVPPVEKGLKQQNFRLGHADED